MVSYQITIVLLNQNQRFFESIGPESEGDRSCEALHDSSDTPELSQTPDLLCIRV